MAAVAEGPLCAYRPQSPDGPAYYGAYEQDGAPLGRVTGGGRQMRCHAADSYCFAVWRESTGNGTETSWATLLQGQSASATRTDPTRLHRTSPHITRPVSRPVVYSTSLQISPQDAKRIKHEILRYSYVTNSNTGAQLTGCTSILFVVFGVKLIN